MDKWTRVQAVAVPMMQPNIDTGQMAPVFVSRASAKSWGERLFANQRYDLEGEDVADFVLNQPRYREAKILVAGRNFGCGSSRETAVWCLAGYGFRCVIAPSFGEIFYDNAFQNGLLLIIRPEDEVHAIAVALEQAVMPELTVDLESCHITLPGGGKRPFDLAAERRTALLEGLDELAILQQHDQDMRDFRERDRREHSWIYASAVGRPAA